MGLRHFATNMIYPSESKKTDIIPLATVTRPLPVQDARESNRPGLNNVLGSYGLSHGNGSIHPSELALRFEQEAAVMDWTNGVGVEASKMRAANDTAEENRVPWRPPHIPKSKFKPYNKCTRCEVHGHFERDCMEFWRISGSATRVDPALRGTEDEQAYETGSESSANTDLTCGECGESHGLWDCEYAFIRRNGPNAPREWKPEDMVRGQRLDLFPAEESDRLFVHHPCEVCFPRGRSRFLSVRGFRTLGHLFLQLEKWRILEGLRDPQQDERLRLLLARMGLSHLGWLLHAGHFSRATEEIRTHITEELQSVGRLLEWQCPHKYTEQMDWIGYEERLWRKEELLLEAQKWELVRWVSVMVSRGGLKQVEKGLLVKLLERLECREQGYLVGIVRRVVVPVALVREVEETNRKRGDPGMSWNCFV